MKNYHVFLFSFLLSGCGGGSADSPKAEQQQTPVTPPVTTPAVEVPKSTKLVDNSVPDSTEFNQFASALPQIPDKTALFKSKNLYLKVYTNNGNALYLGRYHAAIPIEFHVPNHIKSVKYDIFSTDPTDPQISGEIAL